MRRVVILLLLISISAGCTTPRAVRVRCDRQLTPINALQAGTSLRSTHP
jgi:hypothetical protein